MQEVGERIARSAGRDLLERLAEKHGIPPRGDGPPALTGGSDDHGSYEIASAWTATPPAAAPGEVLGHLRAGWVRPEGADGSSVTWRTRWGRWRRSALLRAPGRRRAGLRWWATRAALAWEGGRRALPSIGVGASTAARRALSPAATRAAARGLARAPVVRLDLHPADLRHLRLARAGRKVLELLLSQDRFPVTHAAVGGPAPIA